MTSLTKSAQQSVETIDAMLARIDRNKQAAANTEPGGYAGGSSHPSTDVDDRTDDASEGARSAENTADVKEDQGSSSVDSTSPGTPGGQDSVQMNIGTNQSATGEDSAVETESAKSGKDDPGSSHPARTDNDSLDGHKFASPANVLALVKKAQAQGTQLMAKIAVEAQGPVKASATRLQNKRAGEESIVATGEKLPPKTVSDSDSDASNPPPGKGESKSAAEAGAALANSVSVANIKQAQDRVVIQALAETVQTAYRLADKTADVLDAYFAEKKALDEAEGNNGDPTQGKSEGGEATSQTDEGSEGEEPASSEGSAPAGDPMSGGGDSEQALLELLAGGEGMGADQAAQGMMGGGGGDMGGGMPGGMPGGMGGGDPLAGMGGAAGGMGGDPGRGMGGPPGGGNEQAMLAEALAQAGIPLEAFQALLAQKQSAALKQAGRVPVRGQWRPKTAEEAKQYQAILNYVNEVARS